VVLCCNLNFYLSANTFSWLFKNQSAHVDFFLVTILYVYVMLIQLCNLFLNAYSCRHLLMLRGI